MTRPPYRMRGAVNHADDWLMTYADMISLLLCFFVVILSTSIVHRQVPKLPAAVAIAIPPSPKDFLEGNLPLHGVLHAEIATEDVAPKVDKPKPAPAAATQAPMPVRPQTPPAPVPAPSRIIAQAQPVPLPPKIIAQAQPVPPPPAHPPASVPKGDRITILEVSSTTFFASGTAMLSDAGEAMLRDAAVTLKSDAYKNYGITVEGHTDDTPIHTAQFPSNWELSTARAASVVRFLLDQGIPAERLRAAGYADTFPKVPNRDAAGNAIPENQARNRRVVIKAEKIEGTDQPARAS